MLESSHQTPPHTLPQQVSVSSNRPQPMRLIHFQTADGAFTRDGGAGEAGDGVGGGGVGVMASVDIGNSRKGRLYSVRGQNFRA